MILNFFKKLKEKKMALEKEHKLLLAENKRLAENKVKADRLSMLKKYCPFENDPCNEYCVHFQEGGVSFWHGFDGTCGEWVAWPPKCKLWGKQ